MDCILENWMELGTITYRKQNKADPEDKHCMPSLMQNLDVKVEGGLSERERKPARWKGRLIHDSHAKFKVYICENIILCTVNRKSF